MALLPFWHSHCLLPFVIDSCIILFIYFSFLRWPGGYSRKLIPSAPRFSIRSLIPLLRPSLHQRARVSREKRGLDLLFPVNSRTAGHTPILSPFILGTPARHSRLDWRGLRAKPPLSFISKWQNLNLPPNDWWERTVLAVRPMTWLHYHFTPKLSNRFSVLFIVVFIFY